jgi:hypothetical protein
MVSGPAKTKGETPIQKRGARPLHTQVRETLKEASLALARLDADRLEALVVSCKALERDLALTAGEVCDVPPSEAKAAMNDLAVFARVIEATRANLNVMTRLRDLREGRLEYDERQVRGWARAEASHGDN